MAIIGIGDLKKNKIDGFFVGSLLVSIGILLTTTGGSWDITNHLINKPETFFSVPHSVLYTGVGIAIAGSFVMFRARLDGHILGVIPAKIAIIGTLVLLGAGPADFAWHQAFGLDGLLSPTHLMLVLGMLGSSIGGFLGIRQSISEGTNPKPIFTTILAMLPIWLAAAGMLHMLTLPFSDTVHFKFNPNPMLAAIVATAAFPFLSSIILHSGSYLSGKRFGNLSVLGASFVTVTILTTIIPDEKIRIDIPFYLFNLIPIVVADIILSNSRRKLPAYIAGAILGIGFFTLYFPLITHTYNEVLTTSPVWPSAITSTYFTNLTKFYPIISIPAIASGIFGTVASLRLVACRKRN